MQGVAVLSHQQHREADFKKGNKLIKSHMWVAGSIQSVFALQLCHPADI